MSRTDNTDEAIPPETQVLIKGLKESLSVEKAYSATLKKTTEDLSSKLAQSERLASTLTRENREAKERYKSLQSGLTDSKECLPIIERELKAEIRTLKMEIDEYENSHLPFGKQAFKVRAAATAVSATKTASNQ